MTSEVISPFSPNWETTIYTASKSVGKEIIRFLSEAFKVTGTAIGLFCIIHYQARGSKLALDNVLIAPVAEEIIFRWSLQGTIHIFQKRRNWIRKKRAISQEDLKAQEVFRVRMTAFLFGLAHFGNLACSDQAIFETSLQVVYATIFGLSTGYLKERTESIVLPILCHAINNTISVSAMVGMISPITGLALHLIFQLNLYIITH